MSHPEYPVTLVHPDGREFLAQTPGDYNLLVYGYGYTRKAAEKSPASKPHSASRGQSEQS